MKRFQTEEHNKHTYQDFCALRHSSLDPGFNHVFFFLETQDHLNQALRYATSTTDNILVIKSIDISTYIKSLSQN